MRNSFLQEQSFWDLFVQNGELRSGKKKQMEKNHRIFPLDMSGYVCIIIHAA